MKSKKTELKYIEIVVEQGLVESTANSSVINDKKGGEQTLSKQASTKQTLAKEVNGPKGLEPTRYGDWEAKGRCYDF